MNLSDDFVDKLVLKHAYDPVYAREYYLKNRKLKGRKTGQKTVSKEKQAEMKRKVQDIVAKAKLLDRYERKNILEKALDINTKIAYATFGKALQLDRGLLKKQREWEAAGNKKLHQPKKTVTVTTLNPKSKRPLDVPAIKTTSRFWPDSYEYNRGKVDRAAQKAQTKEIDQTKKRSRR